MGFGLLALAARTVHAARAASWKKLSVPSDATLLRLANRRVLVIVRAAREVPDSLKAAHRGLAGRKRPAAVPITVTRLLRTDRDGRDGVARVVSVSCAILVVAVFHGEAPS
jgi:hypothetical protein